MSILLNIDSFIYSEIWNNGFNPLDILGFVVLVLFCWGIGELKETKAK